MKHIIIIGLVAFLVSGCSTFGFGKDKPRPTDIRTINSSVYPNLPDLSTPPPLSLETPEYDVPRDVLEDLIMKRTQACFDIPKDERKGSAFWADCGEYPITEGSNIHRGFTYDNWVLYLQNMLRIRQQFQMYEERIDEVNRQRQEWRDLNKAEAEKSNK